MLSDDQSGLRWLLILGGSLGVHASLLVVSVAVGLLTKRAVPPIDLQISDRLGGNTFDVDAVLESTDREPTAAPAPNTPLNAEPTAAKDPNSDVIPPPVPRSKATDTEAATVLVPSAAPQKPKPNPPRRTASHASESASESPRSEASGSKASDEKPSTGVGLAYGAAGLPPGVRNLPSAFTRAIPPAVSADPVWSDLPAGHVGSFRLRVELDDTGHIGVAEPVLERPGASVPAHFTRLKQRVIALLGGGQFALKATPGAGTQLFAIDVTLSDRTPTENADPRRAYNIGFEPPTSGRAGRAYFTLGSGRHFEAKVRLMN